MRNNIKMTLSFPPETVAELKAWAASEGFLSPNLLARHLIMSGLKRLKKGEQGMVEFCDFLFAKQNMKREGNENAD
jgi:hypothetical protein